MREICVVLPALNEERTIGLVIDEIPVDDIARRGYKTNIMVVDNGSTDRTGEIARAREAEVVEVRERGKGKAIRAAFKVIRGDFVFLLDADYTYPAIHILEMLEVLEGGSDVVLGSRLKGHMMKGSMSALNKVGNRLLALLANVLYGTRISDPCTGCWGFRRGIIETLNLDADGFDIEADMLTEIARNGYRMAEIPISYRRRATPPKLNSIRDGFRISKLLLRNRFR